MNMEELGFTNVSPTDTTSFSCLKCGKCCRNVKASIPVETIDLFRLARHLDISTDEAMGRYTDYYFLDENGYPVLFLKTTGQDEACIFLKDTLCSMREARPRACRLYPFGAVPTDDFKDFQYFSASKDTHHFCGDKFRIREWFEQNFTEEDRKFMQMDVQAAMGINWLIRAIPEGRKGKMVLSIILLKYTLFDRKADFLSQFISNMALLNNELKNLIGETNI